MTPVPIPIIDSGFAEVHGIRLYYEKAGTGPLPLVFLHAGIADSRMWDPQFAPLAQHTPVLRYDLRGYGQSHPQSGPYSHARDLAALLDHLEIDKVVLCGCSKGGTTAIDFALAYPQRVAGLVLVCAAPTGYQFTGDPPPAWEELVAAFKRHDFLRAAELDIAIWLAGPQRRPQELDPALRERVTEMDLIALANEANGLGEESWLETNAVSRLQALRLPVFVIIGELDDPNLVRAGHWLAQAIPGAQAYAFPDAAHLPNLEQPQRFNQLLLSFMSSLSSL